jgi:hypothetical protein
MERWEAEQLRRREEEEEEEEEKKIKSAMAKRIKVLGNKSRTRWGRRRWQGRCWAEPSWNKRKQGGWNSTRCGWSMRIRWKRKKATRICTYITRERKRRRGSIGQGSPLGRCGSRRTGSSAYKKNLFSSSSSIFGSFFFRFWEELAYGPTDNKDPLRYAFLLPRISAVLLSGLKERRRVFFFGAYMCSALSCFCFIVLPFFPNPRLLSLDFFFPYFGRCALKIK